MISVHAQFASPSGLAQDHLICSMFVAPAFPERAELAISAAISGGFANGSFPSNRALLGVTAGELTTHLP
jgi:hypothetical protein